MRTRPKARQHWRSAVLEALDKLKTCIKALSLTGDRRFPVIALPEGWQIPLERLQAERNSIWAAAMALCRAGVQGHLTQNEESAIAGAIVQAWEGAHRRTVLACWLRRSPLVCRVSSTR